MRLRLFLPVAKWSDKHTWFHRLYRLLPLCFVHAISMGHDVRRGEGEKV